MKIKRQQVRDYLNTVEANWIDGKKRRMLEEFAAGKTQSGVARDLGCSRQYVNMCIHGAVFGREKSK